MTRFRLFFLAPRVEYITSIERFSTMTHLQRPPRFIEIPEVSEITSLGKTSIYQLIAARELRPIKLGRKTVFVESEVIGWMNERLVRRVVGMTSPASRITDSEAS